MTVENNKSVNFFIYFFLSYLIFSAIEIIVTNPKQTHSASVSVCHGKKFASNRYFLADRSNFFAIAAAVNCKYSFHTVCTAAEAALAVAECQCIVA